MVIGNLHSCCKDTAIIALVSDSILGPWSISVSCHAIISVVIHVYQHLEYHEAHNHRKCHDNWQSGSLEEALIGFDSKLFSIIFWFLHFGFKLFAET